MYVIPTVILVSRVRESDILDFDCLTQDHDCPPDLLLLAELGANLGERRTRPEKTALLDASILGSAEITGFTKFTEFTEFTTLQLSLLTCFAA